MWLLCSVTQKDFLFAQKTIYLTHRTNGSAIRVPVVTVVVAVVAVEHFKGFLSSKRE